MKKELSELDEKMLKAAEDNRERRKAALLQQKDNADKTNQSRSLK